MHPKSPKWLEHIEAACEFILNQTATRTRADYEADLLLRSAIERQFQIIGEALLRIERKDPDTARRIPDYRQIIGFRNRMVHGYDALDSEVVWQIIKTSLPDLKANIGAIMADVRDP
jgi:uncharacterized protein with HEPN domain